MSAPKTPGSGRKKGTPNKTSTIRQAFEEAFHALQSDPRNNLKTWGASNATDFYKLSIRLVPTEISGVDGGPLVVQAVSYADDKASS